MEQNFDKVKEYILEHDKFAKQLDIRIDDLKLGYAKTSMTLESYHKNSADVAHGGAIFAIVDFALAAASSTHGMLTLTAAASISYIAAGRVGPITAEAVEVSNTRRLGTYDVKVHDGEGTLIALAQATMYRKSEAYPPSEG